MNVEIPTWMGEYYFEEMERFAYAYICFRTVSFKLGFNFVVWAISNDIWGSNPI